MKKSTLYFTPLCLELAELRFPVITANREILKKHFTWCSTSITKEGNEHFLAFTKREHKEGRGAYFSILLNEEENKIEYVGEVGIDSIDQKKAKGNVYYWVAKKHQGKGYATSALVHLKKWAQQHTKLDYLQIRMEVSNVRSVAVAQGAKANFIKTIDRFKLAVGRVSTVLEYQLIL